MDFDDLADSGSDVKSDVQETNTSDVDYGDGDGVNEFDETHKEMNTDGVASFEFDEEKSPETSEERGEQRQEVSPSNAADEELTDFDDSEVKNEAATEQNGQEFSEEDPKEQTADPSAQADDVLADFDDGTDDAGNVESEDGKDSVEEDEANKDNSDGAENKTPESDTETTEDGTNKRENEDNTADVNDGNSETAEDNPDQGEAETKPDEVNEENAENTEAGCNAENAEEPTDDSRNELDDYSVRTDNSENFEGSKKEISAELKESLSNFEQDKWDGMTVEEQKAAVLDLRDSVSSDLGLHNKPNIEFYNVPDETDFGGYSPKENTIYINEFNMNDANETVDTIAHESRHCWQHERAEDPQNEQDLSFKENFEDYISPNNDYQEYKNQEVEADAREYASEICHNIDNNRDSFIERTELSTNEGYASQYSEISPNQGAVFDQRPDDIESKVEVLPISKKALDKCETAGLSEDKVQDIREIPRGKKPDPDEYLSKDYIDNHLSKFEETGCYKIISGKQGEPIGTIGVNGVFVINGEDAKKIIKEANGDARKLEEALAMKPGYLGDDPYIIRCDEPHNLRMATGNERNAWQREWCPAGVTRGGTDEAVIDPMEKGEYSYKHVFGNDDWHK